MKALIYIFILIFLTGCGRGNIANQATGNSLDEIDSFMGRHRMLLLTDPALVNSKLDSLSGSIATDSVSYNYCKFYKARCFYFSNELSKADAICCDVYNFCLSQELSSDICRLLSLVLNFKGIICQAANERDSSLIYLKKAYRYSLLSDTKSKLPDICINIADVYRQTGDLVQSSSWYHQALSYCGKYNNTEPVHGILSGLGQVYADLNNFSQAQYFFSKAEYDNPPSSDYECYYLYNSRGNAYYLESDYTRALLYFRKALTITRKMNIASAKAIVEGNMAEIFTLQGKCDSAHYYLDRSLDFFNSSATDSSIKFYLDGLCAGLAIKENRLEDAAKYLSFKGDSSKIGKSYWYLHCKRLSELYAKSGNYDKAYIYQSKVIAYDDSLRNAKWKNSVSEIEYRYRQDTILLNKNMLILQGKKTQGHLTLLSLSILSVLLAVVCLFTFIYFRVKRKSAASREKLLVKLTHSRVQNVKNRLSPHFLFNILTVLLPSFSNMPEKRKLLDDLILYLRYNVLSPTTVTTTIGEEIDMIKLYIRLRSIYNSNMPRVEWRISDEAVCSEVIPTMILQVPIENALKYAFPNGVGKDDLIVVNIYADSDNSICIEISDNGIGVNHRSSSSPVKVEGTHSGLRIIRNLMDSLNSQNKNKIEYTITDLKESSDTLHGTLVKYNIPQKYNYN